MPTIGYRPLVGGRWPRFPLVALRTTPKELGHDQHLLTNEHAAAKVHFEYRGWRPYG